MTDLEHLKSLIKLPFYEHEYWRYMGGNMTQFGRWQGFWSTIYLVFPKLSKVWFWKYRNYKLTFPDGSEHSDNFQKNKP